MPVIYIYPYIRSIPSDTPVSDNLYANVTGLFHFDGNTTDSSVIANNTGGITAPVTFNTTTKKFGTASAYFNGSGGYINYTNNAGYSFGTGDFTIEAWINPETLAGSGPDPYQASTIVAGLGSNADGGGAIRWNFNVDKSGALVFSNAAEQSVPVLFDAKSVSGAVVSGKWQHVAVTRQSGVVRFFVDGVLIPRTDSFTTTSAVNSNGPLRIGRMFSSSPWNFIYKGYIDELRISKTARYVTNFTPATDAFSNSATVLLMHMDGEHNGSVFTDESGMTMNRFGNVVTTTSNKIFGSASAFFDGAGDYLTTPVTNKLGFGLGDFTMETWVRTSTTTKGNQGVIDMRPDGVQRANKPTILINLDRINYITNASTQISSAPIATNTWYHVAVSRVSGVTRMFINGVKVGSDFIDTTDYGTSSDAVIGQVADNRLYDGYLFGYMDELRIVKGLGAYTANFTPSSIPFNAPAPALLLQMDGASGSSTFIDDSGVTLNKFGNPQFSTEQFKIGTSSIKFNGTSDYLSTPVSSSYGMGTGDFTIEGWFFATSVTGVRAVVDFRSVGSVAQSKPSILVYNNTIQFLHDTAGAPTASVGVSANLWYNFAWSRVAGVSYFFVNGNLIYSVADTTNYGTSNDVVIGQSGPDRTYPGYFQGYIDQIRIIKGVGMYSSSYTPPTSPF